MRDSILFDGEGVVIDSERIWDRGQEEFLQRRGIIYDREKIKPLLAGRSLEDGARILQSTYNFSGDPKTLAQERIAIVKDLFAHEVEFVPGFKEFYSRIQAAFKTCIATMMPQELLDVVIERLDLRTLFGSHIYCPGQGLLRGKPAPDLFLYAAKQLQSSPQQCIVIEDSPNGIEAAKRADMFCIGIATTFEPVRLNNADVVIRAFDEIELVDLAH
ncbi:MAG TPA: HAD family phosphatase [Candidatus Angelobacter sp.]|jgi:beta-phosphoglucomutase-like phosphatase (HAD superfamily)